ncbi:MAG: hypothetical protein ACYTGH_07740 [Planctomycetota bacterium]
MVPRSLAERLQPPIENAIQICQDIRALCDVAPTPFTGIAPWPDLWPEETTPNTFGDHNG